MTTEMKVKMLGNFMCYAVHIFLCANCDVILSWAGVNNMKSL